MSIPDPGHTSASVFKPLEYGSTQPSHIGHGIGLRSAHFPHLLKNGADGVDWFEIISENFFEPGGRPWRVLDRVRVDVPVVCHGVNLGVGNAERPSIDYLGHLHRVVERVEPAWVSDHLCWGGFGGHYAHDLLPLPHTEEALEVVSRNVQIAMESLGCPLLLENVSSYLEFQQSEMPEWDFVREVARRSGCLLLIDLNNIVVNAFNHGFDPRSYLRNIPGDKVAQLHLSGHTNKVNHLLDSHVGPVPQTVWKLYEEALELWGPRPTLIEWDEAVPAFEVVRQEARKAAQLEQEFRRTI